VNTVICDAVIGASIDLDPSVPPFDASGVSVLVALPLLQAAIVIAIEIEIRFMTWPPRRESYRKSSSEQQPFF